MKFMPMVMWAKIVATTLYTVPLVGDVLAFLFKSTGNDATLENVIRDIVNQKEVRTFIKNRES